jgi:hypothetical protein
MKLKRNCMKGISLCKTAVACPSRVSQHLNWISHSWLNCRHFTNQSITQRSYDFIKMDFWVRAGFCDEWNDSTFFDDRPTLDSAVDDALIILFICSFKHQIINNELISRLASSSIKSTQASCSSLFVPVRTPRMTVTKSEWLIFWRVLCVRVWASEWLSEWHFCVWQATDIGKECQCLTAIHQCRFICVAKFW